MVYKKKLFDRILDSVNHILLTLLMIACIYPFIYILFASFSRPELLMKHQGIMLYPQGFTLRGYFMVFNNPNILNGYKNTLFYVVVGTIISVLLTAMGAYVGALKKAIWSKPFMMMIIFTMFFAGGLIPFYLIVRGLGLYDSRWALILPSAITTWNLIIMRTAFSQLPVDLEESARLDGANDFTILFRIIIPVSKATVAVIILFYAVFKWNSWFHAMILLRSREKFPLQIILREILINNDTSAMTGGMLNPQESDMYKYLVQYTTVMVSILPILFLYPLLQKHFVKGIMIGSIKG